MKKLFMLFTLSFLFSATFAWNYNFMQAEPPVEEDLGTWLHSPQTDYVIYLNATNPYDPTVPGYYISTTSNDRCHNPILACVEVMGTNANAHDCRNYQIQSPDSFMPRIAYGQGHVPNVACPIHDTDPNNPTEVNEAENGGGGPGGFGTYQQFIEPIRTVGPTYASANPGPTELKSAVAWMYENGLTSKSTVDLFLPGDHITREEAAKFYSQFALLQGKVPDTNMPGCIFSDLGGATPDLLDDIMLSCQLGIFKGYQGHFNPTGMLSATDAKVVLIRIAVGMLPEATNDYYSNYMQEGIDMGLFADSFRTRQYSPGEEDRGAIAIYMFEYTFPEYRNNQGNRTDM